jgi:hypothetical protein
MGVKLQVEVDSDRRTNTLYEFWEDEVTARISSLLDSQGMCPVHVVAIMYHVCLSKAPPAE